MFSTCNQVSPSVFILISFFGMSSWMNIVGMWVELPIMVDRLPEGWNLPTYMILIIQLANVAPAVYAIYNKCKGRRQSHNHEVVLCFAIILTSISSCFLTSFFWNTTVSINDNLISLPVFILLSFSSLASCISTLVFLPFMSRFSSQYMYAYYFGQGLSGLLPGALGLMQGLGGNPTCVNVTNFTTIMPPFTTNYTQPTDNSYLKPIFPEPSFSVRIFFLLLTSFLIISLISFFIINFSKLWLSHSDRRDAGVVIVDETATSTPTVSETKEKTDDEILLQNDNNAAPSPSISISTHLTSSTSRLTLSFYLIVVFLLNMSINSIIPATQSYTCLSYGNTVYTLTVRLSSLFNSAFSLLSMFLPKPSLPILAFLTATALSILTFHLVIGGLSPNPPFINTIYGPILIVASALGMTSIFSFMRASISCILHQLGGRKFLVACGIFTQLGSFFGAIFAYLLITLLHFTSKPRQC